MLKIAYFSIIYAKSYDFKLKSYDLKLRSADLEYISSDLLICTAHVL